MHKRIEAMKLAYADVRRYNADPRTYNAPVEALLSKDYAKKRAALIDPKKANCTVPNGDPVGSNTTYLTVVDKDGNIASWIESVYEEFGSGLTAEGMGFILQNRGALFTLDPKHPNVLAGEAPVSHHHTRVHGARRSTYRLRHHGWSEPAAGARAVRLQHHRLRHEHSGVAGRAALHQEDRRRLRRVH